MQYKKEVLKALDDIKVVHNINKKAQKWHDQLLQLADEKQKAGEPLELSRWGIFREENDPAPRNKPEENSTASSKSSDQNSTVVVFHYI